MASRFAGCYTAMITPFRSDFGVDWERLRMLADFQRSEGVDGIVPSGTTGESPTLTWEEHNRVIEVVFDALGPRLETIAGTGSNSTDEALTATKHVAALGIKAALLVDPYYNGPSSLEIRREYYEPIATAVPDVQLIPYIIPGRTGAQMLPQDLAILSASFRNVTAVKEATGSLDNARLSRRYCGPDFSILSGDDDKTVALMRDPEIAGSGVISVMSNIAPAAVKALVTRAQERNRTEVDKLSSALQPLFSLVTVRTDEDTKYGQTNVRARNPLPIKTMMQILGMQDGFCRQPLGRMTQKGLNITLEALRTVWKNDPEVLRPVEKYFGVSLDARLYQPRFWEGLAYGRY